MLSLSKHAMSEQPSYPTLEAVGSGRILNVSALDRPAVLICFAEATQHGADPVEAAVRARYTAAQVLVGHVVDLHSVPSLFRGMARGILNQEHAKAVTELPPGEVAEDYVVILPDWDGAFTTALGLETSPSASASPSSPLTARY